jgi:hypothetical protein
VQPLEGLNLSFHFRTEEEIGEDNLKHVEIPGHITEKFEKDEEIVS